MLAFEIQRVSVGVGSFTSRYIRLADGSSGKAIISLEDQVKLGAVLQLHLRTSRRSLLVKWSRRTMLWEVQDGEWSRGDTVDRLSREVS